MFVSTKDRYVRTAAGLKVARGEFGGEVVHQPLPGLGEETQHRLMNNFGEAI